MVLKVKYLMIGFQVYLVLYGKNQIVDQINIQLGLLVMDQLMQFGLKILIQF